MADGTNTSHSELSGHLTLSFLNENNLDAIGIGCCCAIFPVDGDIVLKAPRMPTPPAKSSARQEHLGYSFSVLSRLDTFEHEREVSAILERHPHPNIARIIETSCPEGIYIQRYLGLPDSTIEDRIAWYADVLSALTHLHDLNIAHADLHPDNILLDSDGFAILCDFSTASFFGTPMFPDPDPLSPRNGFGDELCDKSDRFAAASLMYWFERGEPPKFTGNHTESFNKLSTGNLDLDRIMRRAWRDEYSTTASMKNDIIQLKTPKKQLLSTLLVRSAMITSYKDRIQEWRTLRQQSYGHVLLPRPSSSEIQRLESMLEDDIENESQVG